MSRFSIGPATLLVPDHGSRELQVAENLSRIGQSVVLVNGTWTHLGSLDDWAADDLLDEVV